MWNKWSKEKRYIKSLVENKWEFNHISNKLLESHKSLKKLEEILSVI